MSAIAAACLSQATLGATDSEPECCWICLTGPEQGNPLELPCACPRPVHLRCLARWNLQSAGRMEETICRFCSKTTPDWRSSLTPANVTPAMPVMAIKFEGRTYKLKVKPGPEGLKDFKDQVRSLLGFEITDDFEVCFEASLNGEIIKLAGLSSYGAATHCAAITAGERECKRPSLFSTRQGPSRSKHAVSSSGAAANPAEASQEVRGRGLVSAAQQFRQYRQSIAAMASSTHQRLMPSSSSVSGSAHGLAQPQQLPQQQQHSADMGSFVDASSARLSSSAPAAPVTATPPLTVERRSWLHRSHDHASMQQAIHAAFRAQPRSSSVSQFHSLNTLPASVSASAAANASAGAVPSLGASIQGKPSSAKLPLLVKSMSKLAKKTLHRVFPNHW